MYVKAIGWGLITMPVVIGIQYQAIGFVNIIVLADGSLFQFYQRCIFKGSFEMLELNASSL